MRPIIVVSLVVCSMLMLSRGHDASASNLIGDLNGDCRVDMRNVAAVAFRFLIGRGSLLYAPVYDLDHDGLTTIADV